MEHLPLQRDQVRVGNLVSAKFGSKLFRAEIFGEHDNLYLMWDGENRRTQLRPKQPVYSAYCSKSNPNECEHCNPTVSFLPIEYSNSQAVAKINNEVDDRDCTVSTELEDSTDNVSDIVDKTIDEDEYMTKNEELTEVNVDSLLEEDSIDCHHSSSVASKEPDFCANGGGGVFNFFDMDTSGQQLAPTGGGLSVDTSKDDESSTGRHQSNLGDLELSDLVEDDTSKNVRKKQGTKRKRSR